MRKTSFAHGEYYHIYNRGVDKRIIFQDDEDIDRFLTSLLEFNQENPIGSIYENSFREFKLGSLASKLVDVVSFCLNSNHYHLILRERKNRGISQFMQRVGTGYTKYFNEKNNRSGRLFQGSFKAKHIDSDEYLKRVFFYVNLNDQVDDISKEKRGLTASSWRQILSRKTTICSGFEVVTESFKNDLEFKDFTKSALKHIQLIKKQKMQDEVINLEA